MNPFYNPQQTPQSGGNMFGPFGNLMNMIAQFNNFRSTFQGDPKAKVQELLQSGQMTQEQFNNFSNVAKQFRNFIN